MGELVERQEPEAQAASDDRSGRTVSIPAAEATAAMLVFVDNAGIARVKCVPAKALEETGREGVGMSVVLGTFTATDDFAEVPGYAAPVGDMRLVPDLDAVATLDDGEWLWAPVNQRDQQGDPWPGCQRHFLARMVAKADELGFALKCGGEVEWTAGVLTDGEWRALHNGPSYGAAAGKRVFDLLGVLAEDLEAAGVPVAQLHPEHGDGKLELSVRAADPLRAADGLVLAKQVIHRSSGRDQVEASFSPLPEVGGVGNGAHAHFSLWRDGENLFYGDGNPEALTPEGEAFLAGVLEHLSEMTAVAASSRLSYERLKPSSWAGAYACWGHENREAGLRLEANVGRRGDRTANVEWKAVDPSSNPYLVFGSVIAAGLDGLERGLKLPAAISVDPHVASEEERTSTSATRLPEDLDRAVDLLEGSDVLREAMGPVLFGSLIATRRREAEVTADWDVEKLVAFYRDRF